MVSVDKKHYQDKTLDGILGELGSTLLSVMKIPNFTNNNIINETGLMLIQLSFLIEQVV